MNSLWEERSFLLVLEFHMVSERDEQTFKNLAFHSSCFGTHSMWHIEVPSFSQPFSSKRKISTRSSRSNSKVTSSVKVPLIFLGHVGPPSFFGVSLILGSWLKPWSLDSQIRSLSLLTPLYLNEMLLLEQSFSTLTVAQNQPQSFVIYKHWDPTPHNSDLQVGYWIQTSILKKKRSTGSAEPQWGAVVQSHDSE